MSTEAELSQPQHAAWPAPTLFVRKKNGGIRMCTYDRAPNAHTHRKHYRLPRIDDVFDQLSADRDLSRLDLRPDHQQIQVTPTDIEKKTSVGCTYGQLESTSRHPRCHFA